MVTRRRGKGGEKTKKQDLKPGCWRNGGPIICLEQLRVANLGKKTFLGFRVIEFDFRGQYLSRGKWDNT